MNSGFDTMPLPFQAMPCVTVLHYLKGTGAVSLMTDVEGVDIYLEVCSETSASDLNNRPFGKSESIEHPLEIGSYRLFNKRIS